MRWYVEPLAQDQRTFNAAVLRALDDVATWTSAEIARLERRIEELEQQPPPAA
jgi:hypothetical protein